MKEKDIEETDLEDKIGLAPEQMSAIKKSKEVGIALAEDYPEIEDDYRNKMTRLAIVKKHMIMERYSISSEKVAVGAVHYALKELISKEELKELEIMHRRQAGQTTYKRGRGIHAQTPEERSRLGKIGGYKGGKIIYEQKIGIHGMTYEERAKLGKKSGQKNYEEGKGIFGLTREELVEIGKKGGRAAYEQKKGAHALPPEKLAEIRKKAGQTTYKRGRGIHTLTSEEKSKAGKMGGIKSVILRGQALWDDEQKETLFKLAQDPENQYDTKFRTKSPDFKKIQKKMLEIHGVKRTINSLINNYYAIKKAKRENFIEHDKEIYQNMP